MQQKKDILADHTVDIRKHVMLFDIDGVLCDSQQPISNEMRIALNGLAMWARVFIVTGNSYLKAVDMLGGCVIDGVFCHNADELRSRVGRLLWVDAVTKPLPPEIEDTCMMLCSHGGHYGNRIEWRSPRMLNFSKVGRYAPQDARDGADVEWRDDMPDFISCVHPGVVVSSGGKVSVDIYSEGADKSRAGRYVNNVLDRNFVFVGDRTSPGGNDYPLAKYVEENTQRENFVLTVKSPADTMGVIEKLKNKF